MGFAFRCFVDFKSACFFLLRAYAARTQTSMHILSYVTNMRSITFVILFDLKLHCLGAPLHWGLRANLPCCPPPPPSLSAALVAGVLFYKTVSNSRFEVTVTEGVACNKKLMMQL